MIQTMVTFKGLQIIFENKDLILLSDTETLFGRWVPRCAIYKIQHNDDNTVDITVSEETAETMFFRR